jgi:hypothetical protein
MEFRLVKARRFWAVYEDDTLLCLTVYKKGGRCIIDRLTQLSENVASDARKEIKNESCSRVAMP